MDDAEREREMARRCYGFGRWDAPYWFIGPEQGKGPKEAEDNAQRVQAWLDLGGTDLCDCRDFHARIGDDTRHKEKPLLQSTWRPLMLLLMAFLERPTDNESLRVYQRDQWGRLEDETCVIELSGLAARSFTTQIDRQQFRPERAKYIRQKMLTHQPKLVVMYGSSAETDWKEIADCPLHVDRAVQSGSTTIVFTPHPNKRGRKNEDWIQLGKILRTKSVDS